MYTPSHKCNQFDHKPIIEDFAKVILSEYEKKVIMRLKLASLSWQYAISNLIEVFDIKMKACGCNH